MINNTGPVQEALAASPLFDDSVFASPLTEANGNSFKDFRFEHDSFLISMNDISEIDLQQSPKMIVVPSIDEFRKLQTRLNLIDEDGSLESTVQHEIEHAEAAHSLGATAIRFGYNVWTKKNDRILIATPFHKCSILTTKLGIAAMIAYPSRPSKGDLQDLEELGYEGVEEVGFKVAVHNAGRNRRPLSGPRVPNKNLIGYPDVIPAPKTYTPTSRQLRSIRREARRQRRGLIVVKPKRYNAVNGEIS